MLVFEAHNYAHRFIKAKLSKNTSYVIPSGALCKSVSVIVRQIRLENIALRSYLAMYASAIDILYMCFKQIIKVFSEDGVGKVVEVPADMTARDVCQFLVYKNHCLDDNCWSLVEHHSLLGLGKPSHHMCKFFFCICMTCVCGTHPV